MEFSVPIADIKQELIQEPEINLDWQFLKNEEDPLNVAAIKMEDKGNISNLLSKIMKEELPSDCEDSVHEVEFHQDLDYEDKGNISNFLSNIVKEELPSDCEGSIHEVEFHEDLDYEDFDVKTSKDDRRIHPIENSFQCSECNLEFNNSSLLEKHLKMNHTTKRPLKCSLCHNETVTKLTLNFMGEEQTYVCVQCTKQLTDSFLMENYKSDTEINDNICNSNSTQKKGLKNRSRTRNSSQTCLLCDYKTVKKKNLARHVARHIPGNRYACMYCDYECRSKESLEIHVRMHTNADKPYACTLCDYRANKKEFLITHFRSHTGEKPYECSLCDYKTSLKAYLIRHYRSHTGEKPFACTLCEYKSKEKSGLNRHMRTHTKEKDFACAMCDYKSIEKSKLRRHLKSHMKKQGFACKSCDYIALNKTNLIRHVQTHKDKA